ncbi:MAG: hypothetical protein ACJ75F_01060 [Flavisolibacter sp.]
MQKTILQSFNLLKEYCEKQEFRGWDPYDGLTSTFFRRLPFISEKRIPRLAWIQLFKKSPFNLRKLTGVPKSYNSKGVALFLHGYCLSYKKTRNTEDMQQLHFLAEKLISLQNTGYSGSCWGYYFDWQARAFFQPANTPTVVATSYAADALFEAYECTGKDVYLNTALSSVDFVLKDLNRTYDNNGNFAFSYSPMDHTQVFNASLLGVRLLSRAYVYTKNNLLIDEARKAIGFVCSHQQGNGAWAYGTLPYHQWIDSFHTGFNLECIHDYEIHTGDDQFHKYIMKGLDYYLNNFFREDGASKYYNNRLYPVDIHAPAQLIVTLSKLGILQKHHALAEKVLLWTIHNMQDREGFFYYQKKKWLSSKIPYMRWAQAWMFYSMSHYLSSNHAETKHDQTHSSTGNTNR